MPRTIKKYANRRLYDTHASRHVTLEGIRQLVAAGEDVTVVDDTSGRDITRNILLQVVMEQEQGERPALSVQVLKSLIRSYGSPRQAQLAASVERSVESCLREESAAGAGAASGAAVPLAAHPHEGGPGLPATARDAQED